MRVQCLQMSLISSVLAFWIALITTEAATVSLGVIDQIFININTIDSEIQLNISWNDTIVEDWNYNVIVTPLNCSDTSYPSCNQLSIPKGEKQAVFPEVVPLIESKECVIQPGCTYEVKVETSNEKISKTKQIEIPYCVNDVCSCEHTLVWPKINMTSKITNKNTVEASWTIWMPVGQNASSFFEEYQMDRIYISISQQTNPSLTWGGKPNVLEEKIYRITDSTISKGLDSIEGEAHFQTSKQLNLDHFYQIKTYLIDKKNCAGPMERFVIEMPHHVSGFKGKDDIHLSMKEGIIIVCFVFVCSLTLFLMAYIRGRSRKNTKNDPNVVFSNYGKNFTPDTMEDNILYVDKDVQDAQYKGLADIFEVPHSAVCIGPEIGVGAFGRVFKATAKNLLRMRGTTIVAVKQLKANPTSEEIQEFLTEINMLKEVGRHHNIVSFLGCCTIRAPYMMIMEFVGRGDLLDYLRTVRKGVSFNQKNKDRAGSQNEKANSNSGNMQKQVKYIELKRASNSELSYESEEAEVNLRPSVTETMYTTLSENYVAMKDDEEEFTFEYILDHVELHNFALQIANGMQFLEEQQITHRDLAARNVLIDDRKTLKISDFGLSRHGIYTNTKTRKLPLRWLSIEAIRDNIYSSKSDVWAFGVVLWEIGTLGASPYPTLSNNELIPFLLSGQRLEKPETCSDKVYELMLHCWHDDPIARPSFSDIYQKLQPKTIYVDMSSISDDYVFPPIQANI